MRKGLEALEIIFTLFILIVVVLVIVRMFITKMTLGGIEKPVQDITDTYNYEAAYSQCNGICSKYEADCSNIQNAVRFCLQEVSIDIDGNRVIGETGNHYNVVEGIPLCEDGIYCLHIKTDCTCGTVTLNPESCLRLLCEYYQNRGFDDNVSMQMIQREIHYGSCEPNIKKWKISEYEPIQVSEYDSDWNTGFQIVFMGPDYWWAKAGYNYDNCSVVL